MSDSSLQAGEVRSFEVAHPSRGGEQLKLCYEFWTPAGSDIKNVTLLYLPGVNESCDTLSVRRLAKAFTSDGFAFACLDHHGHGRSVGRKDTLGLVHSFDALKEHAKEFVRVAVEGGNRFILIGHSMGGAIAGYIGDDLQSTYGQPKFIGELLLAPALVGDAPGAFIRGVVRCVATVAPSLPVGPPEDTSLYDTGSGLGLNYGGSMRARTVLTLLDVFENTKKQMQDGDAASRTLHLDFPFCIFQGTKDPVVPYAKSKSVFDFAKAEHKEFIDIDGAGHQPLVEKGWAEVISKMQEWVKAQL